MQYQLGKKATKMADANVSLEKGYMKVLAFETCMDIFSRLLFGCIEFAGITWISYCRIQVRMKKKRSMEKI